MKKFTLLSLIMLVIFVMFISTPVLAGSIHVKDNNVLLGSGNTGIQGNKNHHNTIIGGNQTNTVLKKGAITNKNTNINLNANKNVNKNKNTNVNVNLNKNTNINSNKQAQGQVQGQTAHNEGVSQDVTIEGDSLVIEAAETKREHHTGTQITFASLGSYSESKYAGSAFQTVEMLTMFKDTFSYEAAVEVYGKPFGEGMCKTIGKSYNGRHEDDPSKEIKVYTLNDKIDPSTIESIGFLTVKAKEGKDATSFVVLQKTILSACIMKGDAIVVTKEGAETVTKSSGWGIGFNTSGSVINDMDNRGRSAAASGGTGWSTGKGSLEVLPWMTVQVLKYK